MSDVKWDDIFDEVIERNPGADDQEIVELQKTIFQPLSPQEMMWLHKDSKYAADRWILPQGKLPLTYLGFLRWSNGGSFRTGNNRFDFFPALHPHDGVRVIMLTYGMPEKSPGILPFAFNGGGVFYAFDMRFQPVDGEYAIVAAECGHPTRPFEVAPTFLETCQSQIDFEGEWNEEDEITRPMCDECGEYLVCPHCGKRGPVTHP